VTQVSITWIIQPRFDDDALKQLLSDKFLLSEESSPSKDILKRWKGEGIVIHRHEKRLLVQLVPMDTTREIARSIGELEGLDLNSENAARLASLVPSAQNAILCEKCRKPSTLVIAELDKFELKLKNECGHVNRFRPPILMLGNRILPDINVIVGNNLSRCINLGYFKGFEIVLPKFLLDAIDEYLGPSKNKGASRELESLRKLKDQGIILILYVEASKKYDSPESFEKDEDDFILEQAKLTNSILVTSDSNLKDKAIFAQRPVILIPQEIVKNLKHLEEIKGLQE
jgi:hypothetical protein